MFYNLKNANGNKYHNLYYYNSNSVGVCIFEDILKNIDISHELFKQILLKHNGIIINNGTKFDWNNDTFEDEYCYFENKLNIDECIDELNIILKLLGGYNVLLHRNP